MNNNYKIIEQYFEPEYNNQLVNDTLELLGVSEDNIDFENFCLTQGEV